MAKKKLVRPKSQAAEIETLLYPSKFYATGRHTKKNTSADGNSHVFNGFGA